MRRALVLSSILLIGSAMVSEARPRFRGFSLGSRPAEAPRPTTATMPGGRTVVLPIGPGVRASDDGRGARGLPMVAPAVLPAAAALSAAATVPAAAAQSQAVPAAPEPVRKVAAPCADARLFGAGAGFCAVN